MNASVCADCNGTKPHHKILWFSNSSDVLALWFSGFRNSGIVRGLAGIGEWVLWLIGGILFDLGLKLKVFSLRDDFDAVTNERARVMWKEAIKRGISMKQLYLFGTPIEQYQVEVRGHKYLVDSLPVPPHKMTESLHIDDKISFKTMLAEAGIPAPKSYSARTLPRAKEILTELSLICVKPRSGSNGHHTYPHVKDEKELQEAFKSAKQLCYLLSIEEHLEGNLCRATCIDGQLVGFLESRYPTVIGDGKSTIVELVAKLNASRPEGVVELVMTDSHQGYINRRGHELSSVLPKKFSLPLSYRAGAVSGGSNFEHGRKIHPSFIPIIEHAARLTELPIVGFDLIIPDPLKSEDKQKWGFIEANSLPWINLHATPFAGEPVNVASAVWDMWELRST